MKIIRTTLLTAAVAATATFGVRAAVNTPTASGALERGAAMLAEGNYQGCLDQLGTVDHSGLSIPERARVAWLRVKASYLGGFADAESLLERYLDTYPASEHSYEARLMLADCIVGAEPARALAIYDALAAVDPGEPLSGDLDFHRAYAMMRLGRGEDARTLFEGVVARGGDRAADARFYLGYLAYHDRDYELASRYFELADRRTMPGAAADYYLAQIYYSEGRYAEAFKAARTALDSRADIGTDLRAEASRIAGESLWQTGCRDQGVKQLETYLSMTDNPEPTALYIVGYDAYTGGDMARAVKLLQGATSAPGAMGQSAYLFIGEALMQQGDRDAALLAFDAALRADVDPDVTEVAYYNYAVAKFGGATTPFGSSVATFEDFLRRYPAGPYTARVQEYLVAGYLADRDYDTALASIERMSAPTSKVLTAKARILYALGTRALSLGEYESARDYLQRSVELESYDPAAVAEARLSLGEALYRLGDYEQAASQLRQYMASAAGDTNRSLANYDLGYTLLAMGDYPGAVNSFRQVVAKPGNLGLDTEVDALNRLGDAYLYQNDFGEAIKYYTSAYDKEPLRGDYPLYQQAVIYGYERRHADKVEAIDRLERQFPTSALMPDAMLEKAHALLQLKRPDDAVAVYRDLLERYPTTEQGRTGCVEMAMTLLATGDRDGAVEAYRAVVAAYPTSREARVAVEELQRLSAQDGTLGNMAAWLETIENAPQLDPEKSDMLTFEAAETEYITDGSTTRLQAYLDEYPAGANRHRALYYLMEDAGNRGNVADRLTFATLIVENYPDTRTAEDALAARAAALHSLGRGAEAMEAWQQLATRASTPALQNVARSGMMRLAIDMAMYDVAIEAADALLASSTAGAEDRTEATFSRGLALSLKGDTTAAHAEWQSIASQTDALPCVKAAYYLAQGLYDEGDLEGALAGADAIIDSGTPHTYWLARAFILLSDVFAAQDRKFEAREYLRSLRDNYPGSETDIYLMIDQRLSSLQ